MMAGRLVLFEAIDWAKYEILPGAKRIAHRLASRARAYGVTLLISFEFDEADYGAFRAKLAARFGDANPRVGYHCRFPDVSVLLDRDDGLGRPIEGFTEIRRLSIGDVTWLVGHLDEIARETRRIAAEHPQWKPWQVAKRVGWPSGQVKAFLAQGEP
jgi:hypothetical protein